MKLIKVAGKKNKQNFWPVLFFEQLLFHQIPISRTYSRQLQSEAGSKGLFTPDLLAKLNIWSASCVRMWCHTPDANCRLWSEEKNKNKNQSRAAVNMSQKRNVLEMYSRWRHLRVLGVLQKINMFLMQSTWNWNTKSQLRLSNYQFNIWFIYFREKNPHCSFHTLIRPSRFVSSE